MKAISRMIPTILAAGLLLCACAELGFPAPKTPQQTVYTAKAAFLVALRAADEYAALPHCPAQPFCSDPNVVARIQLGAGAANATLDAAEATVRDPAFKGGTTDAAVVAAVNAVDAFQTIANQLKVPK
jgi:hypothetical protein